MSDADEQAKRPRLDSLMQSPRGRKVSWHQAGWAKPLDTPFPAAAFSAA